MPAILLALLCTTASLPAQEPDEIIRGGCRSCSMSGVKECKKHPSELAEFEAEVRYCSEAARCEDCSGALSLDCGRCPDGPDSLGREVRMESCKRWLDASCDVERLLARPLVRVETEHFEVIIDGPLKDGSKTLDAHTFAHYAAHELEAMARTLDEHYGASPHSFSGRTRLWYWQDPEDHAKVNREIFGRNVTSAMKWYTRSPASSAWSGDKGLDGKALNVAMNACHVAGHLMLSALYRQKWLNDRKAGWFDCGAGHWYEEHRFQRTATYCMDEANSDLDWKGGQWRVAIRDWLAKKSDPILPALVQKLPGTLWPEEHGLSWSLYDWVVAEHPATLKPLLMGFKDGVDARDLFREHMKMTVPQVEAAWREWVAATYPVRDPKARKKLTDKSRSDEEE